MMTVLLGGQGAAEKFMTNLEDGVPENGKPLVVGCVGLVQTLQAASMRMDSTKKVLIVLFFLLEI